MTTVFVAKHPKHTLEICFRVEEGSHLEASSTGLSFATIQTRVTLDTVRN